MTIEPKFRLRSFDDAAFREARDTRQTKSNVTFDDDTAQVLNLAFADASGECR